MYPETCRSSGVTSQYLRSVADDPSKLMTLPELQQTGTHQEKSKRLINKIEEYLYTNKDSIFSHYEDGVFVDSLLLINKKCDILEASAKEKKHFFSSEREIKDEKTINSLISIRSFIVEFRALNNLARERPPLHADGWQSVSRYLSVADNNNLARVSKLTRAGVRGFFKQLVVRMNEEKLSLESVGISISYFTKFLSILGPEGRSQIRYLDSANNVMLYPRQLARLPNLNELIFKEMDSIFLMSLADCKNLQKLTITACRTMDLRSSDIADFKRHSKCIVNVTYITGHTIPHDSTTEEARRL